MAVSFMMGQPGGRLSSGEEVLHDADAGAGAHADGAGVDHQLHVAEAANAAGRLDADALVEAVTQQLDVLDRRAAGATACGRLDEVHTRLLADPARQTFHLGSEVTGLDDGLDDDLPPTGIDG